MWGAIVLRGMEFPVPSPGIFQTWPRLWLYTCVPPQSMEFFRQEYWSGLSFPTSVVACSIWVSQISVAFPPHHQNTLMVWSEHSDLPLATICHTLGPVFFWLGSRNDSQDGHLCSVPNTCGCVSWSMFNGNWLAIIKQSRLLWLKPSRYLHAEFLTEGKIEHTHTKKKTT